MNASAQTVARPSIRHGALSVAISQARGLTPPESVQENQTSTRENPLPLFRSQSPEIPMKLKILRKKPKRKSSAGGTRSNMM
eukprot:726728-Amphidinium_carterae.1